MADRHAPGALKTLRKDYKSNLFQPATPPEKSLKNRPGKGPKSAKKAAARRQNRMRARGGLFWWARRGAPRPLFFVFKGGAERPLFFHF